jgi:WD40 repeat protein
MSMLSDFLGASRPPGAPRHEASGSALGCPIRLTLLTRGQAGLVAALIVALVVFSRDPRPQGSGSPLWSIPTEHPQWVRALALSPDGRRLATTGGDDGTVVVWAVGRGLESELRAEPVPAVHCLAFSPDGATLVAGFRDATVVLWDVATGAKRAVLRGHAGQVNYLAFSPDGTTLATGSGDRSIRLWDLASGQVKAILLGHPAPVSVLRFAPEGRTLASGCAGGLVKLWDLAGGPGRERPGGMGIHRGPVQCLAFSPDGSRLASGGYNDGLKLWDVPAGRERATAWTDRDFIKAAEFAPDGQTLIVARGGGIVQLWDLAGDHEWARRRVDSMFPCVALTPDGRYVASGGADATVSVWDVASSLTAGLGEQPEQDPLQVVPD